MPVRGGGFIQGYNTQNMTSEDGLIIATELTDDPADIPWFEPMLAPGRGRRRPDRRHRPAPDRRPGGRAQRRRTAASGWRWPTPGTAPSTTSPAPDRTG